MEEVVIRPLPEIPEEIIPALLEWLEAVKRARDARKESKDVCRAAA
jgi:hypothetical protein